MIKYDFKELTGDVVTRDDFRYEESRMSWNRAIEKSSCNYLLQRKKRC